MSLLCKIAGVSVDYDEVSQIIHYTSKGNVDTDGPGGSKQEDPDWQPETTLTVLNPGTGKEEFLNLHEVPVIVIPPQLCELTPRNVFPLGSYGQIRWKDGPWVDCVVGDIGPRSKIGEFSVYALRRAGYAKASARNGIDTLDVEVRIHCNRSSMLQGKMYYPRPLKRK